MSGNDERRFLIPLCPNCKERTNYLVLYDEEHKEGEYHQVCLNFSRRVVERWGEFHFIDEGNNKVCDYESAKRKMDEMVRLRCHECGWMDEDEFLRKAKLSLKTRGKRFPDILETWDVNVRE